MENSKLFWLLAIISLQTQGVLFDFSPKNNQTRAMQLLPIGLEASPRMHIDQSTLFNSLLTHASRGDLNSVLLTFASLNKTFIDINQSDDRSGDTLLIRAVESKNVELVKFLTWLGADINKSNSAGTTPLMKAIYSKHRGMIQYILSHQETLLDVKNSFNETALMIASTYRDFETIEELVAKGANLALLDGQGDCAHDRLQYFDDDDHRQSISSFNRVKLQLLPKSRSQNK